ncbi:DUF177 domain-containing protein, partial [Rhizobium ruizarguesonis]
AGEMLCDPDGPDLPDTVVGDTIGAGEVVAEVTVLAIDPYPRKQGSEFAGHVEDSGEEDKKQSAFAVLKEGKKE